MTKIELLKELLGYKKLSKSNQNEIDELIDEGIAKYKNNKPDAHLMIDRIYNQFQLDGLDEEAEVEIKNNLLLILKKSAGYFLKEDFDFQFGGGFNNPMKGDLKESMTTGNSFQGPDSPKVGDLYKRVKGSDGLHRQKVQKNKFKKSEIDIQDKLEKLKKLFQMRADKEITVADIRKILTTESEEQIISAKQYMLEAETLADTAGDKKAMNYYFSESSPITSTFSSTAWSGFKYVYLDRTNTVSATNSFMVKVGQALSKERIKELTDIGIKIYFHESLQEAFQGNDDILDGITYDEILQTVYSNLENPSEREIQKEFEKLIKLKLQDANSEMRKAIKQLLKDVKE